MTRPDRVDGVICLDQNGKAHEITANIVIIATHTFYNVWLLHLPKNQFFPNGIGNRYGQVGKYFHQHPRFGVNGLFDKRMNVHIDPSESLVAINEYTENNFDHTDLDFVMGGYIYGARATGASGLPIEFARDVELPEGVPSWGPQFRDFVAETFSRYYQVHCRLTDPPLVTNFIDLDPNNKNQLGLPLSRATFEWSPSMQRMHQYFYPKVVEISCRRQEP